jgi:DNA end-binding protein Ku
MASQPIEAMSGPWRPSDYRDTYADRVNELIGAKEGNNQFRAGREAPAETNVTRLTQALQASLDAARKKPVGNTAGAPKRRRA